MTNPVDFLKEERKTFRERERKRQTDIQTTKEREGKKLGIEMILRFLNLSIPPTMGFAIAFQSRAEFRTEEFEKSS